MGEEVRLFNGNFDDVLEDANNVYQGHKKIKGESWKTCDISYLHSKLIEELDEFDATGHSYKELLDVINVSLMMAKRLRDEED